jgi:hypothetical protein
MVNQSLGETPADESLSTHAPPETPSVSIPDQKVTHDGHLPARQQPSWAVVCERQDLFLDFQPDWTVLLSAWRHTS